MPKISVIIPIYNVEDYLAKCIDSVLAQSFTDYEIVLVDDGSTDGSGEIAAAYAAKHACIRLLTQENGGLGAARNTGIKVATGEYLLFVDSDDAIEPNTLQVLMDTVAQTRADLVIFDFLLVDEQGNLVKAEPGCQSVPSDVSVKQNPELLLNAPAAWNKLYKKSLFIESGIYFPGRVFYEDFRTGPKILLQANCVQYVAQPLYRYVQRSGSIMHTKQVERNRDIIAAFDDLLAYFKRHGLFETYRNELEFLAVFHVLVSASVRVLKADRKNKLLPQFLSYVQQNFPHFLQNPYLETRLRKNEKIILKLLSAKHYFALDMLLKLKNSF